MTDRAPVHELRALTGVRGIAAWFVVLYHIRLSVAGLHGGLRDVFAKGYLAVDFFFLLSGFVIWLTWSDRLRTGGWACIPRFLQKRIARIWPLHLVTLAAAVALALLLRATGRSDPQFVFPELPLHVLLLQNWGFTHQLAWNDPAWSISAELGAYLLFPLLVMTVDWRRLPSWGLLTIAGGLLVGLHLAMDASTLGTDIPRYGLLRCLMEFTTGSIVCALWLRWRSASRAPVCAALVAVLVAGCWIAGAPETLVVPALFATVLLVLALTAGKPANPFELRWTHYLGEISYATYLSHFILWKAFKLAFVSDATAVSPAKIALYLCLVLLASIALYHLIERPAQRWLNRLPFRLREGLGEGRP
ncbi:acyltransferase [Sphingomonas sp. OK281]|uniref:acyltransferase family protein n=1 Tax=Sphingomonas sp. OK281 TaxID=1881067 RepID=UPI0008EAD9A9|nr:acyltransferase [Sphingomonas sp. OK281]SFO21228.1 Peptidoglycan/LPS O-acetylase OafA/YrhL, contains acyltransferase and SGNH-hydrolase domains [Sphingomonas sp. OK281]